MIVETECDVNVNVKLIFLQNRETRFLLPNYTKEEKI